MVLPETVEDYARLIDERTPFVQANYGDGEWACLLGHDGVNCQGEVYNPTLRDGLRETLLKPLPNMWFGSNPGKKLEVEVNRFIVDHDVQVPWVWKEILPSANVNGHLAPFLSAIRRRRPTTVALVGPKHLESLLENAIGSHQHYVVPDETAWKVVDRTVEVLHRFFLRDGDLVLFASGMASNLAIYQLAPLWPNVTFLDVGALLDPYVGVFSRNGYRKPVFQNENIHKNLRESPRP